MGHTVSENPAACIQITDNPWLESIGKNIQFMENFKQPMEEYMYNVKKVI